MALGRIPKSEGVGVPIGQGRQKRLALFCPRLANIRCGATLCSDARLKSVLIKTALSFHPAWPPQNSLINILQADIFEEDSPETTGVNEKRCGAHQYVKENNVSQSKKKKINTNKQEVDRLVNYPTWLTEF